MHPGDGGSVTRWIGDLKHGGDSAEQHLFARYFERLISLAQIELRQRRARCGAFEDGEDAAIDALDSFFRGVRRDRFPQLHDRDDLWRLLVWITLCKAADQVERAMAAKRGGGKVIGDGASAETGNGRDGVVLDNLVGDEPTPEFAVMLAEQVERLRAALDNDSVRQVFDFRLEGYTREEIAVKLDCTVAAVKRKLDMIRETWLAEEVG
jgi:DNA-directed RNA polymerase specialized sigma24 family protein